RIVGNEAARLLNESRRGLHCIRCSQIVRGAKMGGSIRNREQLQHCDRGGHAAIAGTFEPVQSATTYLQESRSFFKWRFGYGFRASPRMASEYFFGLFSKITVSPRTTTI